MKKKNKQTDKFISKEIKKQTYRNEDYQKVISFFIILAIVVLFVGALYFLNGKYVTKDAFQETTTTTEVTYNESLITVNKMFNMNEDSYMVMAFDTKDNTSSSLYSSLVNYYTGSNKVYKLDLSDGQNKQYYNKEGKENTNPTKASEVVITRPTLMIFKSGKVVSYITDRDEIVSIFKKK